MTAYEILADTIAAHGLNIDKVLPGVDPTDEVFVGQLQWFTDRLVHDVCGASHPGGADEIRECAKRDADRREFDTALAVADFLR